MSMIWKIVMCALTRVWLCPHVCQPSLCRRRLSKPDWAWLLEHETFIQHSSQMTVLPGAQRMFDRSDCDLLWKCKTKALLTEHRTPWGLSSGLKSHSFHFTASQQGLVCVHEKESELRLCFRVSEHIGPFLTTVIRRQYRVRKEMSSCSQNSPEEAMRPPPLTLARIPVGRHTVVGSDMVPVLAKDKTTRRGVYDAMSSILSLTTALHLSHPYRGKDTGCLCEILPFLRAFVSSFIHFHCICTSLKRTCHMIPNNQMTSNLLIDHNNILLLKMSSS